MSDAKAASKARKKKKGKRTGAAGEDAAAVSDAAPVEERVSSDESDVDQPDDWTHRRIRVGLSSNPEQAAREEKVRGWLGRKLRVTIVDGRVYEGRMNCFDNQCNLIISEAVWLKPSSTAPEGFTRVRLSQVLIGGKFLAKCELAPSDPPSLLSLAQSQQAADAAAAKAGLSISGTGVAPSGTDGKDKGDSKEAAAPAAAEGTSSSGGAGSEEASEEAKKKKKKKKRH